MVGIVWFFKFIFEFMPIFLPVNSMILISNYYLLSFRDLGDFFNTEGMIGPIEEHFQNLRLSGNFW